MGKESIGFTLIKLLLGVCILFLLAMLYWSSLLVEKDLKALFTEVKSLHTDVEEMRKENLNFQHTFANNLGSFAGSQLSLSNHQTSTIDPNHYPHMDNHFPNLLNTDPFYEKTLPKILGKNFIPKGIRQEDKLGRPENFHPFNNFRDVAGMINMCSGQVAEIEFGKYETLSPSFAIKMEARPLPEAPSAFEYWVFLRNDLYWEPLKQDFFPHDLVLSNHFLKRHRLDAHDFKFFYDAVMNQNVEETRASSLRSYFSDIEEFRIIDPLTFVVKWKTEPVFDIELGKEVPKVRYSAKGLTAALQPLPSFVYKYFADGTKIVEDDTDPNTYKENSIWAQNFGRHFAKNIIMSCGPWIFNGMNDEGIDFKRNPNYFNPLANLVEGLHYSFKESMEGMWQDFKAGKTDMIVLAPNIAPEYDEFLLSSQYLQQKNNNLEIHELEFVDKAFYYIGWNQATLFFPDKNVRKAMTLAIDRNRIIAHNLNEMGVALTGPFYVYSPDYDPNIEALPFDPDLAKELLEEAGWIDLDGDGIREKVINGKKVIFRFTLTYYAKSFASKVVSEYVSTALKEIGVDCQPNGVDIADISRIFEDKSFDAVYMGWALSTPVEPRQLWHSEGAKLKGSSNAIGFANKDADRIIEMLDYEYDLQKRRALYHQFHKIIHEDAPYTFLYAPKTKLLYREYVKNLFIPRECQDLVPGADVSEPDFRVIYLDHD